VEFLRNAGQKYWQILPLGPTGWGNSPYQSFSAFAANPYYIDLDLLREKELLIRAEIAGYSWGEQKDSVDYAAQYRYREHILRRAFTRFDPDETFRTFCSEQGQWLEDYGLFMALKQKMNGCSWLEWEADLRFRKEKSLARCREELAWEIKYHCFVQYLAFSQWKEIKQYANSLGVSIIGDMPIYVSMDSADVWANSGLFLLDKNRRPIRFSGCPPDAFSAKGQLWGNPLYRWDVMAQTGYEWWLHRLRVSFSLYDVVRIDHFRGFESYYSIAAEAPDAIRGNWVKGPGLDFINTVNTKLPGANIIAEDLGYLTAEVRALLKASGYPGMKVLQFAFDSREDSDYMPHNYERNCVVYTGTHDNDTSQGWFQTALSEDAAMAKEYFGLKSERQGNWAFIRSALSSVARLAVIPMQDYLSLKSEARMNTPSTLGGSNWRWRMKRQAMSPALAKKIRTLTRINGR
jgi:4-alpha-glucanotransferase